MTIIGLILLLLGGHFWFKKQELYLNFIKRTKGIFNSHDSFTIYWNLSPQELHENYLDLLKIAIPIAFPVNKTDNDFNNALIKNIRIYALLSSLFIVLAYSCFLVF
ncbi:MAG: hypothetical protein ACK4ND_04950 [Cytophagaceae bacterium]